MRSLTAVALFRISGTTHSKKKLFSDLTHYVRSGDFVLALLREARNVNEFAFAIGALSHYVGDSIGHSEGINPSTAITFPDLERQYGPSRYV